MLLNAGTVLAVALCLTCLKAKNICRVFCIGDVLSLEALRNTENKTLPENPLVLGMRCKPGVPADAYGSAHLKAPGPWPGLCITFCPTGQKVEFKQDSTASKRSNSGEEPARDLSNLNVVKKINRKIFSANKE